MPSLFRHPGLDPGFRFSFGAVQDSGMPDQVRHDGKVKQRRILVLWWERHLSC